MTAAAFGIAAVVAASAEAFQIVKWVGVAYLAWIGLRLIVSNSSGSDAAANRANSPVRLFRQGFITSSANPFAVMFFAALFPQFIDPSMATLPQLAILGGTYLLVDAVILLAWGWLAIRAAARIRSHAFGLVNRICGILMLGAAILLAARTSNRSRAGEWSRVRSADPGRRDPCAVSEPDLAACLHRRVRRGGTRPAFVTCADDRIRGR